MLPVATILVILIACSVLLLAASVTIPKPPKPGYFWEEKIACPFYPESALIPCEGKENDPCSDCKEVDRFCQTMDGKTDYFVQDPAGTGLKYKIPAGRWCLPPKQATESDCNIYSSVPLLTQTPDGQLKWGCLCTKPLLVTNDGAYGDCLKVVACDPSLDGKLVHDTTGKEWAVEQNWDPSFHGKCLCPEGYKYVAKEDGEKRCLQDSCFPGKDIGNERCECPVKSSGPPYTSYIEYKQTCIQDPCNPYGYTENGKCVCSNGYSAVMDGSVVGNWICEPMCGPKNNPCGNKGTCYIKPNNTVGCRDCRSPYIQNEDCQCGSLPCDARCKCSYGNKCTNVCCKTIGSDEYTCLGIGEICIGKTKDNINLDEHFNCNA
jgi:hypothetical protein